MANAHAAVYICTSLCQRSYNSLRNFKRHLVMNHNGTIEEFEAGTLGPLGSWCCDLCHGRVAEWERHHSKVHGVGRKQGYSTEQIQQWKRRHLTFVPDHSTALQAGEDDDTEDDEAEDDDAEEDDNSGDDGNAEGDGATLDNNNI